MIDENVCEVIYPGVVLGVVKEVDAALGRIKVDFPWLNPPQRSDWASIASLMAGPKTGTYFMPEVDDEVLVAFLHGRLSHPYVVGFLWNGSQEPPEDNKDLRVIKTPGGHTLRFEDVAGQKKIVIKTDGGRTITLDDSGTGKIEVKSGAGQTLTMDDAGQSVTAMLMTGTQVSLGPAGVSITSSSGPVTITAPNVNLVAPLVTCSGVLQAQVISGLTYTPGVGNLI